MTRQRLTAVWAAFAVGFLALLSLFSGLAVNAVPKSWHWAHNWRLLIGISALLFLLGILATVLQVRSSGDSSDKSRSEAQVAQADRSSLAGSNAGTMISAETVIIGSTGAAATNGGSTPSVTQQFATGMGDSPGSGLRPQRESDDDLSKPESDTQDYRQARDNLVLRANRVTKSGDSISIEIFNTTIAKQWILNDPWGHSDAPGGTDGE